MHLNKPPVKPSKSQRDNRPSLAMSHLKRMVAVLVSASVGFPFFLAAQDTATEDTEIVSNEPSNVVIETSLGKVEGVRSNDVLHFRSIGYATPPIGELRFLAPQQPQPWSGTFDATQYPNRCNQPQAAFLGETLGEINEDCLYLNIITPSTEGEARPVLFWIHGGGFVNGSANEYNGDMLAQQGDVVVVTINYRLGLLGYLDLSAFGEEFQGSASNGFRDQIMALQWVHDNIADYGGDPNNVTIFGESAGGASVLALLAAPSADQLFHKAIAHSPGLVDSPPPDVATPLMARLDATEDAFIGELRKQPIAKLLELQESLPSIAGSVDGEVITRTPIEAIADRGENGVPLIAGTNRDEGKFFTALFSFFQPEFVPPTAEFASNFMGKDPSAYIDALKTLHADMDDVGIFDRIWVAMFSKAAIGAVSAASTSGNGGWLYQFDLPATEKFLGSDVGATHAAEIAFTFNRMNAEEPGGLVMYDPKDPLVQQLSQQWSDTVIQFAKTGSPNGGGLPDWQQYDTATRQTLVLDAESRIDHDLNRGERLLWEEHWVKTTD